MKRFLLAAPLILAGCASSVAGLRHTESKIVYVSQRSAPALEPCLAENLERLGAASTIRGERETILNFSSAGATSLMITLTPLPQGTRISARTEPVELLGGNDYSGLVKSGVERCI